jgi:hypothetical protein
VLTSKKKYFTKSNHLINMELYHVNLWLVILVYWIPLWKWCLTDIWLDFSALHWNWREINGILLPACLCTNRWAIPWW